MRRATGGPTPGWWRAAGEHTDEADPGALYAWLLRAGGQRVLAQRVLDEAHRRSPTDPVVQATESAFRHATPVASGVLLEVPHRMAPYASLVGEQAVIPPGAEIRSQAVLVGDGSIALVPLDGVGVDGRLWGPNGMGHASRATVDASDAALAAKGLALLRLRSPLPLGDSRESGD